jgi:hypothetical protein
LRSHNFLLQHEFTGASAGSCAPRALVAASAAVMAHF